MREIAEAADLSPANLYNYFKGKHEILFFCQDSSLERMLAALEKARFTERTATKKLGAIIEAHLRCVLDEVEGFAAHFLTTILPSGMQRRLLEKRDRYEDGVRRIISDGVRRKEFVACDPALTTRAILGAVNWSVRWFNPEGPLASAEIAAEFSRYLVRGLALKQDVKREPMQSIGKRTARRATREAVRSL